MNRATPPGAMAVSGSKRNWFSDRIRSGRRRVFATRFRPSVRSQFATGPVVDIATDRRPRDFVKITAAIESMSRLALLAATVPTRRPPLPAFHRLARAQRATSAFDKDRARECIPRGHHPANRSQHVVEPSRNLRDSNSPMLNRVLSLFSVIWREHTTATFHRLC